MVIGRPYWFSYQSPKTTLGLRKLRRAYMAKARFSLGYYPISFLKLYYFNLLGLGYWLLWSVQKLKNVLGLPTNFKGCLPLISLNNKKYLGL